MENNFNQNTPVPEETTQDASQETTAQAAPETAPKPPVKVRRVGTFSLGLMLVAIGAIQLAQIFMPNVNVLSVVKYAPVVLIVLGIEVLIYAARPDVKIKYDVISIFLCIIIMLTAGASGAVAAVAQAFTPENVTKRVTTEEQYKKSVQKALSNIPKLFHRCQQRELVHGYAGGYDARNGVPDHELRCPDHRRRICARLHEGNGCGKCHGYPGRILSL